MSKDQKLKKDKGKAPITLIPFEFTEGVARVLAFGASKYGRYCWAGGMEWHRLLDGVQRHLGQFESGEDKDKETGECHLLHAACGIVFLYLYWKFGMGKDDRWKRPKKEKRNGI